MQKLHVVPPKRLLASLCKLIVKTKLSEILCNYLPAKSVARRWFTVIGCAIFSVTEALFFLELFSTGRTCPRNKTRREFYVVSQVMNVAIKFFYEVKSKYVVTTIPQFDGGEVVRVLYRKLSWEGGSCIWGNSKVFKNLAAVFSNQHTWNTDSSTRSVVSHNHICYVLLAIIDNYNKRRTGTLSVSDFRDKRTVSTVHQHDLCGKSILLELEAGLNNYCLGFIFNLISTGLERHFVAPVHVLFIEVDLSNLQKN